MDSGRAACRIGPAVAAESGLLEESQEASLTWRVTPDMICILDRDGRFVAINPAWTATLGWSREEIVGQPYLNFLHPDDVDRSNAAFETVMRGEPVLRFENRYRAKSGAFRWFSWVAVPEGDRFYCTVRDVTDDKEQAESLARKTAEGELREQFLAVLGHDLRNPLAAFSSGTRLLSEGMDDPEKQLIARQMQSSVTRMSDLIDNLMDLARVRLGDGLSLDRQTTDTLADRLIEVIEEIRLTTDRHRIESHLSIEGPVTCDVTKISQIVSNLVANAVTHGDPKTLIRFDARTRDGRLIVRVANGGERIPEKVRENLFRPFFRGVARESQQGLGLGLYIASEIAKAHDGELTVTSDDDVTEFRMSIPC